MKGLEGRPDTPDSDFVGCDERGLDCAPLSVTEGLWVSCSTVLLGNSVAVVNFLLLEIEAAGGLRLLGLEGEGARESVTIFGRGCRGLTLQRTDFISDG